VLSAKWIYKCKEGIVGVKDVKWKASLFFVVAINRKILTLVEYFSYCMSYLN